MLSIRSKRWPASASCAAAPVTTLVAPPAAQAARGTAPAHEPEVSCHGLGKALYSRGYQATCRVVNGKLVCGRETGA